MQKACRRFEKVLLRILNEFTSEERSEFFFYCKKSFPISSEDEKKQMLALFRDLQENHIISPSNVSFMKEFTDTIYRLDLTNILMEYESEVEVAMILEEYADIRDGNPNLDRQELSATQAISKDLSRNFRDGQLLTDMAKLTRSRSIEEAVNMHTNRILVQGEMCWPSVLEILGFSSELAYRRMCFHPGPSKFHRWLSDIDAIFPVLRETIVPWMAQNGGAAGCAKFIGRQDPKNLARDKEIEALITEFTQQYTH
ncbi:hypothetical protein AC249_AIPGENE12476 [Exaiptasia diaphana]|nr:hypothetical protein AC249_AIPGENE12476 [Exaiptasia diaphana]